MISISHWMRALLVWSIDNMDVTLSNRSSVNEILFWSLMLIVFAFVIFANNYTLFTKQNTLI